MHTPIVPSESFYRDPNDDDDSPHTRRLERSVVAKRMDKCLM